MKNSGGVLSYLRRIKKSVFSEVIVSYAFLCCYKPNVHSLLSWLRDAEQDDCTHQCNNSSFVLLSQLPAGSLLQVVKSILFLLDPTLRLGYASFVIAVLGLTNSFSKCIAVMNHIHFTVLMS